MNVHGTIKSTFIKRIFLIEKHGTFALLMIIVNCPGHITRAVGHFAKNRGNYLFN